MSPTDALAPRELGSIYVHPEDRFVVCLIASYGSEGIVRTPKQAAAATLALTRETGCHGTVWFVYDRRTGRMRRYAQGQF